MKKPAPVAILFGLLLASAANAQHSAHPPPAAVSPYSGMEQRRIKALSDSQIEDLKTGRGMSLALAAELNGYPGPMHVLELSQRLELKPEQASLMQSLFSDMRQETSAIGREVIEAETELDALFAGGLATRERLAPLVGRIAEAQGRLRAAHLRYHLDTRAALSQEQVERYARLRGYAARP